ncbi:MAG: TonB-dependent receptor [Bryobacterales bacterium]|nr:TonB-dependent receptor [Bryobacterales bacterium]
MILRAVVLLVVALDGLSQVSTGVLFGDVRDESSGLVAGAVLTVRREANGFTRSAAAGSLGEYRFDDLPPGVYSMSVSKPGFRPLAASSVVVEVNQKRRLDLVLKVGAAKDVLTVTAPASLLQTGEASEGYLFQSETAQPLPLLGRNIYSLVTLGPGAIPRQLGGFVHDVNNDLQGGRGAVALNAPVNGARSSMNTYVLDGAYNTDRNIPAQYPQSGGALVDAVTKSGSRDFHGNAFEFFRNEATDARGVFDDPSVPRPIVRQNQFGASLGGPAGWPSTYFYAAYEGLRGQSAKSTLHLVPDASLRAGDFRGRSPIFDPESLDSSGARLPFAGNMIPSNRLDSVAGRFLTSFEPLPNHAAGLASNYIDATPNQGGTDSGSLRIDHQFPNQSAFFARYTINDERTLAAGNFPELPTSEQLRAQQAALGYTISGRDWVNQARFSFTRLRVFDVPESAFQTDVIRELGIHGGPTDPFTFGLPFFVVTNFDIVTDSPTLPQVQRDNLWNLSDGVSLTSGRHTLQTGAQWIHFQLNYLQSQFPRGQYLFGGSFTAATPQSLDTGDPFADFLVGFPQTTKRFSGRAQAYLHDDSLAGYFQDDYRVSSRLTLNLGLRYEYFSPYSEKRGSLLNLDYSTLPSPPKLLSVSRAVQPDRRNFAPRIGAAWSVSSVVLRAGYGIFYSPEIAVETYDLVRNGLRNEVNQITGATPVLTIRDGFPQNASAGFPTYFGLDPRARTPYVQQWSASLQRQLPGAILAEASYIGAKGTRLGRFRTFNTSQHVETGENLPPRPGDLQSLRTFPSLGPIYQRQHISNSIYHSLQLKAEKRLSGGLSLLASFVWSKSIDDADDVVPGQFDSFGAQDERNLRLERGLSFFDVRRRFSAGFFYRPPAAPWLRPLLSNWEFSGIAVIQDGTPLNPVYFVSDFANSGTPNRPNVVPGQNVRLPSSQRSINQFFNRAVFSDPRPFTFGNAGRNILPGPGNNVFDLSIHRRFPIGERQAFQLRIEAFNAFNHPNWGIPGPYPDFGPFFGKIFAAGDQRRLQFGLRYDF